MRRSIFQLAHAFREDDRGDHHSEEFLMLEWYKVGSDEFALMDECEDLIHNLTQKSYCAQSLNHTGFHRHTVTELFAEFVKSSLDRESLEDALHKWNLVGNHEQIEKLRYDEIFFTLFLNLIEIHLGKDRPCFVHGYPAQLAANSVIEGNIARRFEIYWKGVELGNGYFELTDFDSQKRQFDFDNQIRHDIGRETAPLDPQLMDALKSGLPVCSGVAVGVDRLLMVLRNEKRLDRVTPVYSILP